MATWLIIPALLARKMNISADAAASILSGYESFGIAWRLLDDVIDLEADIKKGVRSSVYWALSDDARKMWDRSSTIHGGISASDSKEVVHQTGAIDVVIERICSELESAASVTDSSQHSTGGLAEEYRSLMKPLRRI